jgi:Uma2 family endonuclease
VASTTIIRVEEYLQTDYTPDCDYVDGAVLERNVGERDHSALQAALAAYLYNRRRLLGIHVFTEQRLQISANRFRVPDLCVMGGQWPDEKIFHRPPLLCIEILSEEDRMSRMLEKIDDFLRFGVRYIWVINPQTRQAYVYTSEGSYEARDGVLRTEAPEIVVPLQEVFNDL